MRRLCIDCGKSLGRNAWSRGHERCLGCAGIARRGIILHCLDCGKVLSHSARSRGDKRCIICAGAMRQGTHRPWTWRDGMKPQPYSQDWKEIRETIRKRDGHLCQHPDCYIPENGRKHDCHHVDRNRSNNHPANLLLLCKHHHGITKPKHKDVEFWQLFYEEVQTMRGIL